MIGRCFFVSVCVRTAVIHRELLRSGTNMIDYAFQGQLTQDWLTVFDINYINDKMLGGLRRASGKIEDYCEKLAVKAFSLSKVLYRMRKIQGRKKCIHNPNNRKQLDGMCHRHRKRFVCFGADKVVGVVEWSLSLLMMQHVLLLVFVCSCVSPNNRGIKTLPFLTIRERNLDVHITLQAREEAKAKMGLAEVEEKALTVPRPFNLTRPSIRKVPEPMKIEQVIQKS